MASKTGKKYWAEKVAELKAQRERLRSQLDATNAMFEDGLITYGQWKDERRELGTELTKNFHHLIFAKGGLR